MRIDPVLLEILSNKVTAATEEMCYTLQRTGRTLYVKETADFCAALANLDGKFFAYPRGIGVSGFIDLDCGPAIRVVGPMVSGDVIVTNHPYESEGLCTHPPDIHLIQPYFHDGRIIAYGWSFVHLSDVGGRVPSSISPTSHELFQEGLLIPPMKMVRGGKMNPDFVTLFRANCRTPDANLGDIQAMLAALAVGERRVAEMIARHGADTFLTCQQQLVDYTAAKARAVLRRIPNGTYTFWDYLDDDLVSGIPVRIRVAITAADGEVHLDFTGSDPQVMAAFNVPTLGKRHPWLTLRIAATVCTLDKDIALNTGLFDPIKVTVPKGTILNPEFPAAVGVRHATAIRVNDVLNGALAQAIPDVMPAASGGQVIPVVLAERDKRTGRRNVLVIEPMVGGMGARRSSDGVDGRDSGISNLANNPLETVEADAGIRVLRYGLRTDSGGPGEWRGGVGLELAFEVLQEGSAVLGRGMERFRFRPWGLAGGKPGTRARTVLNLGRGNERELGKIDLVELRKGDVVTIMTSGAGGYGDPYRRDPALVLRDTVRDTISVTAARDEYGVVIAAGAVDEPETQRLRRMRPTRPLEFYDFGPERVAWEAVFDDVQMTRLAEKVRTLPPALRQDRRQQVFLDLVPALDKPGADLTEALHDHANLHRRFGQAVAAVENEFDATAE